MDGPEIMFVESNSARYVSTLESGSNVDAIDKSHSEMVKFSRGSTEYKRVSNQLRSLVDEVEASYAETLADEGH
jgi:hypothetical protein